MREIVDALRYWLRTGCAWEELPHDFPPKGTVYDYWRAWIADGTWLRIHNAFREQVRRDEGKQPEPTAGIVDTQTVKTTERGGQSGSVGYDVGKRLKGRKRHLLVDTLGLLQGLVVHSAGLQDRDGAKPLLAKVNSERPCLIKVWADGAYRGGLEDWVADQCHFHLEIVEKEPGQKTFKILHKRWIVERTFGWLMRFRRLLRDFEYLVVVSEAVIHFAMLNVMLRRLAM